MHIANTANSILSKEIVTNKTAIAAIGITVFIFLIALGAYVYIPLPFTPVPLTLQTFFVLLCATFLGKKLATITQLSYIILGAAGMPLFSPAGAGAFKLFGPTGGYIAGFALCAYIIGKLLSQDSGFLKIFFILALGAAIILCCGALWLWLGFRFSAKDAFFLGVAPFVPGDIIKATTAAFISKGYIKRSRSLFS